MEYRIGTRGSKLALAQAEYVCGRLAEAFPEDAFEIQVIKTRGDVILDKPLHEIGDKGVFVKEIEEKLLSGEIQIAVHSMKDMPSSLAPGLVFTKAWKREDPRDVLILREKKSLSELPRGAVIGTGSKRREFQLKRLRPDLRVVGIRGNVDTRIRKMREEKLDGILLAAAGLHRLGMEDSISQYLEPEEMISAPAQGILALEIREGELKLLEMINRLGDEETDAAAKAERGFLQRMGGSCHIPVGAILRPAEGGLSGGTGIEGSNEPPRSGEGHITGSFSNAYGNELPCSGEEAEVRAEAACQIKQPETAEKTVQKYRLDAMFGDETGTRQAYVTVYGTEPEELAEEAAKEVHRKMAGKVTLLGAGPGDPGLITVKGLAAIREADCIVYDRLASPELLAEAKPQCEKIYVGKANHCHTMKQEEINQLLVQKSMEYDRTLRLKGGDVYVFGRGGEEGLYLRQQGVEFEVIPGVSSCIAGPAYAGIPITHRGKALGFHVVTAHDRRDELADIDFKAMAGGKETCVFLMGLSKVEEIAKKLMAAGMRGDVKAAVISRATTPKQQTCVSDLLHIAEKVKDANLVSPALIIVGDVVSLREDLNFYENRPLSGKQYLIPRIGSRPTRLGELLKSQGALVDEVQVGEIVSGGNFPAEELGSADWLIFTSKNGVNSFFRQFWEHGLDLRSLASIKIAAIGGKTAETLKELGLYADLIPDEFHSDALAEAMKQRLTGSETVWYLKAGNADSHLREALEGHCRFREITVYENCAAKPDLEGLAPLHEYNGILFTCASSAKRLSKAMGNIWDLCKIYSIGPKTTEFLKKSGAKAVLESKHSTYEGLAERVMHEEENED